VKLTFRMAGMTPVQAIQATGDAARFLDGDTADWGTIARGRRADLLAVSGPTFGSARRGRSQTCSRRDAGPSAPG
jgi:imidazolonepropionase-like amidohydrolase